MGKRGSVLLHVLMTGALLAIIAATMMRLALMRFSVTARATNTSRERRYDESALGLLTTQWNATNVYCANVAGVYSCSGGVSGYAAPLTSCACTCNPLKPDYPTVVAAAGAPPCRLTITSTDMK